MITEEHIREAYETRVMVDEPLVSEDYVRPTVRSTPEDRINSIREQLASRTFLERMIEQFQMYGFGSNPKFLMESAVKTAQRQIGIEKTSNNTFTISFVPAVKAVPGEIANNTPSLPAAI